MSDENGSSIVPQNLLGWLVKVAPFGFRWLANRIRVKEIHRQHDPDIEDMQEFFEKTFAEDNERIDSTDLVTWLTQEEQKTSPSDNLHQCLLVGKHRGKIVALLKAIYCPVTRHVFLAYFAVGSDESFARKAASRTIVCFFKKYISRKWKDCYGIVYEVELQEPRKRKKTTTRKEPSPKVRLFRELARRQGLHTYRIGIEYYQPHMAYATSYETAHVAMDLMYIPLKSQHIDHLNQAECKNILWLIIHRVYGATQRMTITRKTIYLKYLERVHQSMTKKIPNEVILHDV